MDVSSMVSMFGWFVQVTFDKLLSTKLETWASRLGLHHDIGNLKLHLRTIKALLGTLKGKEIDNEGLVDLLTELKDAAYDAEDLLDELDYYRLQELVAAQNDSQVSGSSSSTPIQNVINMADRTSEFLSDRVNKAIDIFAGNLVPHDRSAEIQSFPPPRTRMDKNKTSCRLKELVEKLTRIGSSVKDVLNLENLVAIAKPIIPSHETSSFLTAPKVFGREKEKEHIVELLLEPGGNSNDGNVCILPLIGNGGVGKTTLAQVVYNHPRVVQHFDLRMWVCVSNNFDEVRLTKEMLEHACNDRHDSARNLNRLQEILLDKIVSKRFLLVLDDVRDAVEKRRWDTLCAPLKCGQVKGSKILATTRMRSVAKMIARIEPINLNGLPDDEFWSFFRECAFGDEKHDEHPKLQIIGREIAKKLKGYPLAAKSVGWLLNKNLDEEHWTRILESDVWKFQKGQYDIMSVLKQSYQHLPGHLQHCFAICSLFPKDCQFDGENLVYIWMAHGFIQPQDDDRRLEDIGKDYLNDLLSRSFFQLPDYGSSMCFVMHDSFHDLAQYVSVDECSVIDGYKSRKIAKTVRHLSLITDYAYNLKESEQLSYNEQLIDNFSKLNIMKEIKNLRTLMFFGEWRSQVGSYFQSKIKYLENIRVLVLSYTSCPIEELSGAIENFIHLRYLDLHGSRISALPESICKLYHLQVLDLRHCNRISNLPKGMNNLFNLRHLCTSTNLASMIAGIGNLIFLQELENFYVRKENGYDLGQLRNMKELRGTLHIKNLENVENKEEAMEARLKDKKYLNKLFLHWGARISAIMTDADTEVLDSLQPPCNLKYLDIRNYMGARSPKWMMECHNICNIESICLTNCRNWDNLPHLQQLQFLKILHIVDMHAVRQVLSEILPITLEELRFERMLELNEWSGARNCQLFPRLREIAILDCPKLSIFPPAKWSGIQDSCSFPSLHKLVIKDCPALMVLCPLSHHSMLTNISIERVGLISALRLCKTSQLSSISFELHVENCPQVRSLDDDLLQHYCLRGLKKVTIIGCEELMFLPTEGFSLSLEEMTIKDCPKLTGAPPLLLGLTELTIQKERFLGYLGDKEVLHIENCPSLSSLGQGLLRHRHLSTIKSLFIDGFEDLECLPAEEFQELITLRELVIQDCPNFRVVAPLPPSLTELRLQQAGLTSLPALRWGCDGNLAQNGEYICSSSFSSSLFILSIAFCPELSSLCEGLMQQHHLLRSIGKLVIIQCRNLEYLPKEGFRKLMSLRLLVINSCPKLMTSMMQEDNIDGDGVLPQSLEQLEIGWFKATDRQLTSLLSNLTSLYFLKMSNVLQMSSLVLPPLTELQNLIIEDCEELTLLDGLQSIKHLEELHVEGCPQITFLMLRSLTALRHLNIRYCKELKSLDGLQNLTNLKTLHIEGCPQVAAVSFSSPGDGLPSLEILYIEDTSLLTVQLLQSLISLLVLEVSGPPRMHSQVTSLTDEQEQNFQCLTSLQKLYFFNCPGLHSLPADLRILPSLVELYMKGCSGIRSLPERGLPMSLKELWISECCEELRTRCLRDGADWQKIAHIPDIKVL